MFIELFKIEKKFKLFFFLLLFFFFSFSRTLFPEDIPKRIISLSPSITEILFSIGAGSQVIAVDSFSNYPPEAPSTSLSSMNPNMESIALYNPDLVILSYDIGDIVKGLNTVGISTILLPAAINFDDIISQINYLGKKTGNSYNASEVSKKMISEMTKLENLMNEKKSLKVYHEIDENYYSASSKSFIGNVYNMLNFINIADEVDTSGTGYPKLSAEYILSSNPEFIVVTTNDERYVEKLKQRPGWLEINAIKENRYLVLTPDIGSRWGPRIVDFAKEIVDVVKQDNKKTK